MWLSQWLIDNPTNRASIASKKYRKAQKKEDKIKAETKMLELIAIDEASSKKSKKIIPKPLPDEVTQQLFPPNTQYFAWQPSPPPSGPSVSNSMKLKMKSN